MIRQEAAQAAIDLAQELERVGLCLKAIRGGSIDKLNNAATTNFEYPQQLGAIRLDPTQAYTPNAEMIERDSMLSMVVEGKDYGSEHARFLEEAILETVEPLRAHLNFARNIVKPAIVELHNRLDAFLKAYAQPNTFNPNLVFKDVPNPLIHPSILDEVEKFKNEPYVIQDHYKKITIADVTIEQIKELMMTGNSSVDAEIHQWLINPEVNDGFIMSVWNSIFGNSGFGGTNYENVTGNLSTGTDAAMIAFLIARNIKDNPIEGAVGTLSSWKSEIGEIYAQSAVRLLQALDARATSIRLGRLIISKSKDVLVLNKPVYDDFISQGGNNTILFGVVLSDRSSTYVPDIMQNTNEFISIWERQNKIMNMTAINRRYTNLKTAIKIRVQELIGENFKTYYSVPADGQTIVDSLAHPMVQASLDTIEKIVDDLSIEECEDIWAVCLKVVGLGIFGYTDAYQILNGIDVAKKVNQSADVGECSLISTLEYVIDYIADQLAVDTLK